MPGGSNTVDCVQLCYTPLLSDENTPVSSPVRASLFSTKGPEALELCFSLRRSNLITANERALKHRESEEKKV